MSRTEAVPRPVFDRAWQLATRLDGPPLLGFFTGLRDAFVGFYPPPETDPNTKETTNG